ncbi:hypothetical protein [Rossellomorea aquimaris]|uniref:hypothetical protein n=1 Tax=Rossellomorea TaxID=2837508 RepID=UPI0016538936|nr:hypothetical protein [Rossellomorea aquimaris]
MITGLNCFMSDASITMIKAKKPELLHLTSYLWQWTSNYNYEMQKKLKKWTLALSL